MKGATKYKVLYVRTPDEMREQVAARAKELGISTNDYVLRALGFALSRGA